MIVTFETPNDGKIEVNFDKGEVYFYHCDVFGTIVDRTNYTVRFTNPFTNRTFLASKATSFTGSKSTLEVYQPVQISVA